MYICLWHFVLFIGQSTSRKRPKRNADASTDEEEMNGVEEEEEEEEEEHEEEVEQEHEEVNEMVPNPGIRIDQTRLNHVQSDVIMVTEGWKLEKLERIYSKLMDVVMSKYKDKSDRTQLPKELQAIVDVNKTIIRSPSSRRH